MLNNDINVLTCFTFDNWNLFKSVYSIFFEKSSKRETTMTPKTEIKILFFVNAEETFYSFTKVSGKH